MYEHTLPNLDQKKITLLVGYDTVAINNVVNTQQISLKDLKIDPLIELIKRNAELEKIFSSRDNASRDGKDAIILDARGCKKRRAVKVLSRITVVMTDAITQTPFPGKFKSSTQTYDLFSVQPHNEKQFRSACSDLDVDIITFDFSEPLSYKIRSTQVSLAISRGIYFEICYSQAIEQQKFLRNAISGVQSLMKACKGRNLIMGSGAKDFMYLRPPRDVENLAFVLFGIDTPTSRAALSHSTAEVEARARIRRKSFMGIAHMELTAPTEQSKSDPPGRELSDKRRLKEDAHDPPCPGGKHGAPARGLGPSLV